jgi:hypothetical protein
MLYSLIVRHVGHLSVACCIVWYAAPLSAAAPAPPNKVLFLENLPTECTDMMLSMLFQSRTLRSL